MVIAALNLVVGGTGAVLTAAVAVYHTYHVLRAESGVLHGPLAGYYRVLLPYILVSCVIGAAFFIEAFLTRARVATLLPAAYLWDMAFLGITLVWLGTANHLFSTLDAMTDKYFAEGDGGGG